MKCLIVVAFLALAALAFADELVTDSRTNNVETLDPVKNEIEKDAARDKRTILAAYTATAPIAYTSYSAPIAYSAYPAYPYPYASYRTYPYVGYSPYIVG